MGRFTHSNSFKNHSLRVFAAESERIREDDLNWKYWFIDIPGDVAKRNSPG